MDLLLIQLLILGIEKYTFTNDVSKVLTSQDNIVKLSQKLMITVYAKIIDIAKEKTMVEKAILILHYNQENRNI